eukprot:9643940-Ditylum_brightwellii.AAC.1
MEVIIDNNGNINKDWIIRTTSDAAGKLQPDEVLTIQLFNNFEDLARPYDDFPEHMTGNKIEAIPDDSGVHLLGNSYLHIVSLPLGIKQHLGLHARMMYSTGTQDVLVTKRNTSPNGRVSWHTIWAVNLVPVAGGIQQVQLATLPRGFEGILQVIGSKSDRAHMHAKSLTNFLEE